VGGEFTFSDTSLLVFRSASHALDTSTLEWTDRKGVAQTLPEPPRSWAGFVVSPDGKLIAADIGTGQDEDIWIYDRDRRTLVRMTFGGTNQSPVWSPDGRWVTFGSIRDRKYGIYRVAADKSGQPELLLEPQFQVFPMSWTPDGKTLFYTQFTKGSSEIWTLQVSGNGESQTRRFTQSTFSEGGARVSPDGKWVAYRSNESGKAEVYVAPFSGPGGKSQISTHGGSTAIWSRSGRELFYQEPDTNQLMAVDVPTGSVFRPGTPHALFKLAEDAGYDVTPDPNLFLVEHVPERQTPYTFVTVTNWFDELLRRAPVKH
jgi:Tol biopolymer transport system component